MFVHSDKISGYKIRQKILFDENAKKNQNNNTKIFTK